MGEYGTSSSEIGRGVAEEIAQREQYARDAVELEPAQLKAKYGAKLDTVRDARDADARRPPPAPPAEREPRGALERGEERQDGGRPAVHKHGRRR